jgi:peptide/nickel transport system substrate-binding protein
MTRPLSIVALSFAVSCGGGGTEAPPATGPVGQDMLVIAAPSDIGHLLSPVYEANHDAQVMAMLNFPLVDADFDCSLKKEPGFATEWAWNEDGTVLSMTLRDDLKFSDGHPMTAEDIAFTYELIADPVVASPRVSSIERLTADGRPRVIDATHIEWHFTQAYDRDTQISHVGLATMPKHVLESADRASLRGHPYNTAPLSSGPWRMAEHSPNERIVLEPNPDFSGPESWRPHLKRVVFQIIPDYNTRLLKLEAGEVDLMEQVQVADADRLRTSHPEIRLVRRGWRSMEYIGWNLTNPLFQDVRVRRALSMSIDAEDMMGKLLTSETGEVYARRSVGTITPALCGVHNDDIAPITRNVDQARALFAEAGWTDTDGDGVLDKDGQKFEFRFTTNNSNARRAAATVLIQAQLAEVGVKANIEQLETNTFFEKLRLKEYDAALAGWAAALTVDPSVIWHGDVTCEGQPEGSGCVPRKYEFNFTGYNNPRVNELIDRGMATPIPEESAPIFKELQQVIYDDQPYTFLWWTDEIVAVHSRFEHAEENINVLSPFGNVHEWSVPDDKVLRR